jgi:hypothetical protein
MTWSGRKLVRLVFAVVSVTAIVFSVLPSTSVSAAEITSRSLTLQAGVSDGGSKPSGVVNHLFTFTLPSVGNTNVGSIQFLYCTTAGGTCFTPPGLSTTSAAYGTHSGVTFTSIVNTTNGAPYLSRTSASVTAGTTVTEQLTGITNPSTANQPFYIRISTFASIDTTGSPTDTGTVAASTANQITLTGTMPESLIFCTGATISTTGGVPDCSTATSGAISFNQLFSPSDTATATSQMSASTNASTGYSITVNGPTLTSGSNTVTAMNTAGVGVRGTSQFGLNLIANTTTTSTPAVGTDLAPVSNTTNYKGQPLTGYGTADTFKYLSGDPIANSADGGAGPTDSQIYTTSYIVNVNGAQAVGTYTTTLTYICTATF